MLAMIMVSLVMISKILRKRSLVNTPHTVCSRTPSLYSRLVWLGFVKEAEHEVMMKGKQLQCSFLSSVVAIRP